MTTVLLADPALAALAGRFAERLPDGVNVVAAPDFSDDAFRRLAIDAGVLVNAQRPIDAAALAMAPALRFIQMIGVGLDPIDRNAVAEAGIAVAYNPGVNRSGAAEHAIMLMLALIKRLPASERATRAMTRGSYLINTGRGGLVDESALRSAIVSGHLAGAGIDVLEHETDGVNPFADLPEVIVTPHLGGGSRNSMTGVVERSTANIRRFLAGEPLRDQLIL